MRKAGGPSNLYICALSKPEVLKPLMSSTLQYKIFFFKKIILFTYLVGIGCAGSSLPCRAFL